MKHLSSACFTAALFLASFAPMRAETSPPGELPPEEHETVITCELMQAPRLSDLPVLKSQKEADNTKGTYHYKLWLPKGYNADAQKRWPSLFIMSPGGDASLGNMAGYLATRGFVGILLVEARNGPWEPIVGNFLAAHDDAVKRVRLDEGRKYATGLSGGARASSLFVQSRPGFSGLLLQGAGASFDSASNNYHVAGIKRNPGLFVAMTMGDSDSNKGEAERMKALIPAQHFAVFPFQGGHDWAPPEVFEKAMDWLASKTATRNSTGAAASNAGKGGSSFDDFFKKK